MSVAINRQDVERQLRREMPGTFDYQPHDVQRNLVDTRIKNLQAQQPATPADAAVVRVRTKPAPAHLTPPPLPSRDADERELRARLKEAQAAYADVLAKAGRAKTALARAEEHLHTCETQLKACGELDNQATELRIRQLKEAAFLDTPHHLQSAFRERGEIIDKIQIAAKAHQSLQTEARNAEAATTIAHERVLYACRDVVFCSAWRLLDQLVEAEEVVNSLRSLLASCRLIGVPGVPPMHLPAEILDAVSKTELPAVTEHNEYTGIWNGYALALRTDAAAQPDTELLFDAEC